MENNILKIIADNPELIKTLRKLFEDEFFISDLDLSKSDEMLGQQVRASLVAKEGIKNVFAKILNFRTLPERLEVKNPAR